MPRIQQYGGPWVGPVQKTSARFRAADNGGGVAGAVARGMQQLGGAVSDYAQAQDQIEDRLARTSADTLYLNAATATSTTLATFKTKAGKDALDNRQSADQAVGSAIDTALAAADPRTRQYLEPQLRKLRAEAGNDVAVHTIGQMKAWEQETGKAKFANLLQSAVTTDDPAQRTQFITDMKVQARDNAIKAGLGGDEILQKVERDAVSGAHTAIVNRYMADKDYDMADAYFRAHAKDLSVADEAAISADLAAPMMKRWAAQEVDALMVLPPISGAPGKGGAATPVSNGGDVIKGLFPAAVVTSTYRPADHPLSRANPKSWHTKSHAAVDVAPIKGMSFEQYVREVEGAGYTVLEALNETGAGRSKHATGDHWHIVLGEGGGGAAPAPRRWDMASVTDKIYAKAEKDGWSIERRDAVLAEAKERVSFDEQLQRRSEDDADRSASEWVNKHGASFTDIGQMPNAIRSRLHPDARRQYENQAKQNATGTEAKANGAKFAELEIMRANEPEKFMKEPLGKWAGSVTRAEMHGMLVDQAKMLKGDPDAPIREKVSSTISTYDTPDMGLGDKETGAVKRVRIQKLMERELLATTEGKRKPTEAELYQSFINATKQVTIPHVGMFGGVHDRKFRRYEIEADNIPPNIRAQIEAAYKRQYGVTEVPPEAVVEAYQASKVR